jgi:hypothetical protein
VLAEFGRRRNPFVIFGQRHSGCKAPASFGNLNRECALRSEVECRRLRPEPPSQSVVFQSEDYVRNGLRASVGQSNLAERRQYGHAGHLGQGDDGNAGFETLDRRDAETLAVDTKIVARGAKTSQGFTNYYLSGVRGKYRDLDGWGDLGSLHRQIRHPLTLLLHRRGWGPTSLYDHC